MVTYTMGLRFSPFLSALIAGILLLNLAGTAFAAGKSMLQHAKGKGVRRVAQRALPPPQCFVVEKDSTERTSSLQHKRPGKRRPLFLLQSVNACLVRPQQQMNIRPRLNDGRDLFPVDPFFHRRLSPPSTGEEPFAG
ncbi:MAG: hypothetical protein AB7G75_03540 [Candidatus Binatia bacterium]